MTTPALKKLSQEAFDSAVEDLVDGLGLEPEEAIASACEEFEIQGFSLEGIVREVGGAAVLANLPTAKAAGELKRTLSSPSAAEVSESVALLKGALEEAARDPPNAPEARAQLLLASAKEDAAASLLASCDLAEKEEDEGLLALSLETLKLQLDSDFARDDFVKSRGPRRAVALLEAYRENDEKGSAAAMVDLLLQVSTAAMKEQEEGKCCFMSEGLPKIIAGHLDRAEGSQASVEACCSCIRGILTADDTR